MNARAKINKNSESVGRSVGRWSTNANRYEHVVALLEALPDESSFLYATDLHHRQHSMATHSTHTDRRQVTTHTRHSTHNCSYRITINISHFNAIDTTLCRLKAFDAYRCAHAPSPSERRRNSTFFGVLLICRRLCLGVWCIEPPSPASAGRRRARAAPFSHSLFGRRLDALASNAFRRW